MFAHSNKQDYTHIHMRVKALSILKSCMYAQLEQTLSQQYLNTFLPSQAANLRRLQLGQSDRFGPSLGLSIALEILVS
jgi:hypothetical protein